MASNNTLRSAPTSDMRTELPFAARAQFTPRLRSHAEVRAEGLSRSAASARLAKVAARLRQAAGGPFYDVRLRFLSRYQVATGAPQA